METTRHVLTFEVQRIIRDIEKIALTRDLRSLSGTKGVYIFEVWILTSNESHEFERVLQHDRDVVETNE
jgi:hypothetical protein